MKLALVQAGLGAGGAERVINLLATHRANGGDDVHVIAHSACASPSYYPYPANVHLHTMPARQDRGKGMYRVSCRTHWLRHTFKQLQPDLIISFLTKTNVLSLLAAMGSKTPVIISERNNPKRQHANPLWQPLFHYFGRQAQLLVMQTAAARDTLPGHLHKKSIVIPNPCHTAASLDPRPNSGKRVVAVGRLDHQKGFDLLISAFAQALQSAPGLTLTIFGEGPERLALQEQAGQLGISAEVSFPGLTNKPHDWLHQTDIFALSSRFEGFANVLVEAMSAGLPCVAFDCPWSPAEMIISTESGLLVPDGNVEAFASAIANLSNNNDLRRNVSQNAPRAVEKFALSSVMEQWDQAIEWAIGSNTQITS